MQLELYFSEPQSLKEKRMLLKSVMTRIRNRFNVTASEIDGMDLWQKSVVAIASVAREQKQANQILSQVTDFVRGERGVQIANEQMEFF